MLAWAAAFQSRLQNRNPFPIKGSRGMEAGHNNIDPARMKLINAGD